VQACLVLCIITLICYWPVVTHDFVNVDDQDYVTRNPHVQAGLTSSAVVWAFGTGYFCSWQPLTWISHILDCQFYGLNPGGHHLTSLLFHVADTLLVFLLLANLTRAVWRSGLVAALFACHPVHVESVAWISERKDVLSTFFLLFTLWFYARYASLRSQGKTPEAGPLPPGVQRSSEARWRIWFFYALSLLFFACGLMSKSMLVTLPAALLLLDYWPLRRFGAIAPDSRRLPVRALIVEKLPFFALAFASSVVTFLAQRAGGAVSALAATPIQQRFANIPVAYLRYLQKTVWPSHLAMFYPYPAHWPLGLVLAAVIFLAFLSILVILCRRTHPYLVVGWLWYLGTLVPVIGLVQVGGQSMADRYMYIPSIGLFIAVVWGLSALLGFLANPRVVCGCASAGAVLACLAVTSVQVRYWRDGVTLCRHTVEVTSNNYFAYCYLGEALSGSGDTAGALSCYARAVQIAPQNLAGQFYLGSIFVETGRVNEAIPHLERAVAIDPSFVQAQNNLGIALMQAGRQHEALQHFTEAARLNPEDPDALFNLGRALLEVNKPAEAAIQFRSVLRLRPGDARAHYRLAGALTRLGETAEAIFHYRETLRLTPDSPTTLSELSSIYASNPDPTLRAPAQALEMAQRACELTDYQDACMLTSLAAAYAEAGRCQDAVRVAQQARDLALTSNQTEVAGRAGALLELAESTQ
jgi:Flp pilus assembly protein TadD